MEEQLLCYNRCCGKSFNPKENTSESCVYHPGVPIFHDAYKKWSCCEKKTTDFTEFLNIKGCTNSYHSNIKPPEPEKNNANDEKIKKDEVYTYTTPQPLKKSEKLKRPDEGMPMTKLKFSIGSSLQPLLEKLKGVVLNEGNNDNSSVKLGTPCKNDGCKEAYKGEESNNQTCVYHSGVPIFHEGLKYWSCCIKRTTDFDSFLEQVGCTTGNHLWHKPKNPENETNCRYDWHQTGNSVVISVYCKCSQPDLSCIEANPVKLKMKIVFGNEQSIFTKEIPLFGVIDIDCSSVNYLGSKVEIKLKKAEPISWRDLAILKKIVKHENHITMEDNINSI